jgi:PAS domain S-box-containing protein
VEDSKTNPKAKIGIFLSDLEEGSELIHALENAEYAVLEVSPGDFAPASVRNFDALIFAAKHWEAVNLVVREAAKIKAENDLPPVMMVCGSPNAEWTESSLEEPDESTTLLSYPLNRHVLIYQLRAALRRRKTHADLRYRLREREDVLKSISEVFFSVDHEFRYTFFNEKAQQVGGKSYQEVIGKNMWEMFPALKNTEFDHQMRQVAQDRQILIAEYLGPITGGWFEMRIYPSAGGISALFVDISARKKAEASLKKTQEQLTEANSNLEKAVEERTSQLHHANEQLEELLYSIAHDLRSPLRSMEGFAHAFVEEYSVSLDDRAKEYARRMTSSAIFMDRMLKDLLELSRITMTDVHLEPVSLTEAWEATLLNHDEKIKITNARVHPHAELGYATANRALLIQVLDNLMGNALKFGRKNVPPEIKVWMEHLDDHMVEFNIEDNGIGIDERHRDKVFRVFERLNGSEFEGAGIGLAIARKASERMKGHLDFTSNPGAGTRFRLKLRGK